jgi:PAS domain S-box-containing protein
MSEKKIGNLDRKIPDNGVVTDPGSIRNQQAMMNLLEDLKTENLSRRSAEEALQESLTRFQYVSSSISELSYSCLEKETGNFCIDWLIGNSEKITGYTIGEMKSIGCWCNIIYEDDSKMFRNEILDLTPGRSGSCEARIVCKSGDLHWIRASAVCVESLGNGGRRALYGGIVDITEKKEDEVRIINHLNEQIVLAGFSKELLSVETVEELFRFLGDTLEGILQSGTVIVTAMASSGLSYSVRFWGERSGIRRKIKDTMHIDPVEFSFVTEKLDQEIIHSLMMYRLLRVGKEDVLKLLSAAMDRLTAAEIYDMLDIGPVYTIGIGWNSHLAGALTLVLEPQEEFERHNLVETIVSQSSLTLQRLFASEQLTESERLYRTLVETSPDGIVMMDLSGMAIKANRKTFELIGLDPDSGDMTSSRSVFDYLLPNDRDEAIRNLAATVAGKGVSGHQFKFCRTDGTLIDIEVRISVIPGKNGVPVHLIAIMRDITEQNRQQMQVVASEARYRSLYENMIEGFALFRLIYDKRGRPVDFECINANAAFSSLSGIRDVIGRKASGYAPSFVKSNRDLLESFAWVVHTGTPKRFEYYLEFVDKWVDISVYSGEQDHFIVTFDEITARKKALEELVKSEERYRMLMNTALVGIVVYDEEGRATLFNNTALKNFGLQQSEFMGKTLFDIMGNAGREHHERLLQVARGKHLVEFEDHVVLPSGEAWYLSNYNRIVTPDGEFLGVQVMSVDITERKLSEKALIESEEKYRRIVDISPDAIIIHSGGILIFANPTAAKLVGARSIHDIVGQPIEKFIHPDYKQKIAERLRIMAETGKPAGFTEEVFLKLNGESFVAEVMAIPLMLGGATAYQTIIRDITRKKMADARLVQLSTAVEQSPASVVITDPEGTIEYVNPKFTKVTGYSLREALGKNPRILKSGETPKKVYKELWKTIKSGKEWKGEFKNLKKNGQFYYEWAIISPITDEKGKITHYLAVKEDITEARNKEEKIREYNEQLRALSYHHDKAREDERLSLARDIHDVLGSSLSGMKMHLQVLRQSLTDACEGDPDINTQIEHLMEIANDTIGSMRRLVRGLRPGILDELGFVEAVKWFVNDIQSRSGIAFRITVFPQEIRIRPDKSIVLFRILQEILTNILEHSGADQVIILMQKEKSRFFMKVTDNGKGISRNELSDKNSFGIMGMKERVIILKGKIDISGSPGNGTTVTVDIPLR